MMMVHVVFRQLLIYADHCGVVVCIKIERTKITCFLVRARDKDGREGVTFITLKANVGDWVD